MRITVSGPPGSGTTTLAEFGRVAEEDPEIDREIDERQTEIARENDDIVLEGRLSGWMAEDADMRVWLDAPVDVRAERVAEREEQTVEEARVEIEEREASESKRYQEIHGIDIDDLSIYDLVVDTSTWDKDGVAEITATAVERL